MKRILRPALAFALALSCSLAMLRFDSRADAYNGVICMWIGGNILPITTDTMPFADGDQYYVPASVFSRYLGCTVKNSNLNKVLSIKYDTRSIFFRHDADYVLDEQGQFYQNRIIKRNGVWYVPAQFTAKQLGMYSSVYSAFTPTLVYIDEKTPNLNSDDAEWFLLYGQLLADRYIQAANPRPQTGDSSGSSGSASSENEREKVKYTVYLAFRDFLSLPDPGGVLDELASLGIKATLSVSPGTIDAEREQLLRRARVEGHSIALGTDESFYRSAPDASEELRETSDGVSAVLFERPRTAIPAASDSELTEALADAVVNFGARLWTIDDTVTSGAELAAFEDKIRYGDTPVAVEVTGENYAELLRSLVEFCREDESSSGADFRVITVLEKPINSLGDMR